MRTLMLFLLALLSSCVSAPRAVAVTVPFSSPPFTFQFIVNQAGNSIDIRFPGITNITYIPGTTAYISNQAAYLGTNNFSGGGAAGVGLTNNSTITWTNLAGGVSKFAGTVQMTKLNSDGGGVVSDGSGNLHVFSLLANSTLNAASGTFSVDGSGNVAGTSFTGGGSGLTSLNASQLASGTAPPSRLGSGSTDGLHFLRGDSAWALVVTNVVFTNAGPDTLIVNDTAFLNTNGLGSGGGSGITQLTGDVLAGPGSGSQASTLVNIPDGTIMAGSLLANAISAPSTPASGKGKIYEDATSKNMAIKNDAGVVNHGGQTKTVTSHLWLSSFADDGTFGATQPSMNDLSTNSMNPGPTVGQFASWNGTSWGASNATSSGGTGLTNLLPSALAIPTTVTNTGLIPVQSGIIFNSVLVDATPSGMSGTRLQWSTVYDINGDGLLDIIANGTGGTGFEIFTNVPGNSLSFSAGTIYGTLAKVIGGPAVVADFNGDGNPDIAYFSASQVAVYTNTSNSHGSAFGQLNTNYNAGTLQSIATADFNLDGKPDLAFFGSTGVEVLTNDGTGIMAPYYTNSPNMGWGASTAIDVNNDGRPDLIGIANTGTPYVLAFTNNTGPTFFGLYYSNFLNGFHTGAWLNVGDFNGDGLPDYSVADMQAGVGVHAVVFYTNNGAGFGLFSSNNLPSANAGTTTKLADFNMDGRLDLIAQLESTPEIVVITNGPSGFQNAYTNALSALNTGISGGLSLADFTSDGRPDIIAGNVGSPGELLRNEAGVLGRYSGDAGALTNGQISVVYQSAAVTPSSAWKTNTTGFGEFDINTNYYNYVAGFNPLTQIGNGSLLTNITTIHGLTNLYQLAQSAAKTLAIVTSDAAITNAYEIGGYVNITAASVDILAFQVTYTDELGSSTTISLASGLATTGHTAVPTATILCKNNTTITVAVNLTTSGGSVTYDAFGFIRGVTK